MKRDDSSISGEEATLAAPASADAAGLGPTGVAGSSYPPAPLPGDVPKLAVTELLAGRYSVVRYIARGGMGEVYEAEDRELNVRVALKTIRGDGDEAAAGRFKREIHLARKVTHPNVCRIFDVGFHVRADGERVVFLTMELLDGETLAARIHRGGAMDLDEARGIARQIAAGLSAAHAAHVVHRDLKSANVLLVPRPSGGVRAVITDFGLAHVLEGADERLSLPRGIVGTPGYMAPEQVEGGALSAQTDLYAFGVVLFEMVTARLPFEGSTPMSIATKRLTVPAPSPRSLRRELPSSWERAVLACLVREPRARVASARAVIALIEEAPDGVSEQLEKLHRRAPIIRPALALLAVVVASLLLMRALHKPPPLAGELVRRGVVLGAFSTDETGDSLGYSHQVRNALRADLMFDVPVFGTRIELAIPGAETMRLGLERPIPPGGVPLRIDARCAVRGQGTDRAIEVTMEIVDPLTHERRMSIVERGALRALDDVVAHVGARLRATAGLRPSVRAPLSPAGAAQLERALDAHRGYEDAHALELLEALLPTESASSELRFMIARVLESLEMDTAASVAIRRTLELGDPEDPYWHLRVQALATSRDAARSTTFLEEMHRMSPSDLDVTLNLATVLTEAQRGSEAATLLRALDAATERDRVRIGLARLVVAERRERWDEVGKAYPGLLERSQKLGAVGLELRAMRSACAFLANQGGKLATDRTCDALGASALAQRAPGSIALAFTSGSVPHLSLDGDKVGGEMIAKGEALAIELGARRTLAEALNGQATLRAEQGRLEKARPLFDEALAISRDAHDHQNVNSVLSNLAYYEAEAGHLEAEGRYLRESLEVARDTDATELLVFSLCRLGSVEIKLGDIAKAHALEEEARRIEATLGPVRECQVLRSNLRAYDGDFRGQMEALRSLMKSDQALQQEEMVQYAQKSVCEALLSDGQHRAALKCIEAALAEAPKVDKDTRLALRAEHALVLARLGRLPEARALARRLHDELASRAPISTAGWATLDVAATERLVGVPAAEISPAVDRLIAAAEAAHYRGLEGYARLERLELRAREHAPETPVEARALAAFASRCGYTWLAAQAQRLAVTR